MNQAGLTAVLLLASAVALLRASESLLGRCVADNQARLFNCSGIGLSEIPNHTHIPVYAETLDLSGNHIYNITHLDYATLNQFLRTIDLSNNQISVLRREAFKELNNLVNLDLSQNMIIGDTLDEFMFDDLRKLQKLNMERNPLRIIKTDTFGWFELSSLKILDLSHCEISVIEERGIDISGLEHIDLSWNQLDTFNDNQFHKFGDLKTLDLSHNRIRVLNTLPYMPFLETWYLDSNGMVEIHIDKAMGYFADSVQNLYLRNNEIKWFGRDDLPLELESIKLLDMSDNQIACDCKMKWIAEQKLNIEGKTIIIPCQSPSNLYKKDLLTVPIEDLTCNLPLLKILFIVVLSCVSVIIIGTIAFFVIRRHKRRQKRKPGKGDDGGDYTAVYQRDEDDVRVTMSDSKTLIEKDREFDV